MFFTPWGLNVRNPKMLTTLLQTLSKQRGALVTQTPQIPKITLQRASGGNVVKIQHKNIFAFVAQIQHTNKNKRL